MDFNIPEDMKMLQTLARDFVNDQLVPLERELLGREADLEGVKRRLVPEKEVELARMAKELGLWALNVPEELGGAGLDVLGVCLVEEELSKTIIPFKFGDVTPILFDCSEEQKKDYLLPLVEGEKSACLALFEPEAGAGPTAVQMQARKTDSNYILNGNKVAFTNDNNVDFAIVFAVTTPQKGPREGITCFLVDSGTPGFTVGWDGIRSGWEAQVAQPLSLIFENCKVPASKILGEEGKAFRLGNKWLPARRIVRGARCVGAALRLLDTSVEHVKSWQSYGQTIAGWPNMRMALADISTDIQAARLMVYQAACKADDGQDVRYEAAMVKVFTTEMLKRTAARAVLIKGGPAPAKELPLEILCRSMLVSHIAEHALEVQKSIIASNILKAAAIL